MVKDEGEKWTFELWELAEQKYKKFLTRIKIAPMLEILPSKLMDEF